MNSALAQKRRSKSGKNEWVILIVHQINLVRLTSSAKDEAKWQDYPGYMVICVFRIARNVISTTAKSVSSWREIHASSFSSYLLFAPTHRAELAGIQVFKYTSVVLSVIYVHHKQCLVQYDVYSVILVYGISEVVIFHVNIKWNYATP